MTRREIIERLGAQDAERLFLAYGGTRVTIPGRLAMARRLAAALDDMLATRLVLHFGDSRFYVPLASEPQPIDPKRLKRLISKGHSSARIARTLGCSERTVDKHRAKLRAKQAARNSMASKSPGNGSPDNENSCV